MFQEQSGGRHFTFPNFPYPTQGLHRRKSYFVILVNILKFSCESFKGIVNAWINIANDPES